MHLTATEEGRQCCRENISRCGIHEIVSLSWRVRLVCRMPSSTRLCTTLKPGLVSARGNVGRSLLGFVPLRLLVDAVMMCTRTVDRKPAAG